MIATLLNPWGGDGTALGGDTSGLSLLKYSREQESDADAEALAAIVALYRHGGGSQEIFHVLEKADGSESVRVSMLSTHPLSPDRIVAVDTLARRNGWAMDGPRTALEPTLAAVRSNSNKKPD